MSINIQMQDGQGNIIHPQTKAELVQYKDGNANSTLQALEDREELFISDSEPEKDGLWVDTTDIVSDENVADENPIAKQIKKYINDNVITKYDKEIKDLVSTDEVLSNEISKISNPNLLINGDFRTPVNQRGKTVYNTYGYSVDRWIVWHENTSLTINDRYCTLTGNNHILVQSLEFPTTYSNEIVTLSAKVRSNGGALKLALYGDEKSSYVIDVNKDTEGEFVVVKGTGVVPDLTNNNSRLSVSIEGMGSNSIDIEWVKLEYGSLATPFVSRSYGEELALCQRYYISDSCSFREGVPTTRVWDKFIPFRTHMRVTPTINASMYNTNDQNTLLDNIHFQVYRGQNLNFWSDATMLEAGVQYTVYYSLDAEIY